MKLIQRAPSVWDFNFLLICRIKNPRASATLAVYFYQPPQNANNPVENLTSGMLDIVYNVSYGIKLKI